MIYLDNAATTYPKPNSVRTAVETALRKYGANPGRAGHNMSLASAEEIYRCRTAAADFFHAPGPECVAFTINCTHALNYVLKGFLRPGDHVVTSCLEHNAVARPLHALTQMGVAVTKAQVYPGDHDATVNAFRRAICAETRLIICTHASNVWGIRLPVERIAALGHEYRIPIAVDCAQSAGMLPIDMADSRIDYLCIAGHKGLYGPMGTGLLVTANGSGLATLVEGGTGTNSAEEEQPEAMPERMESGTQNMPGIAGLRAGIEFVRARGTSRIFQHEMELVQYLYRRLSRLPNIRFYTAEPDPRYFVPVLSFNVGDLPSETVGRKLNEHGIAVRSGLHCAPDAHRFYGTLEQGAVRICPSAFTRKEEMEQLVRVLASIQ
ncbi:MAG: aminotransferase class V-fold PLP-dependent enzyme [Oscillospiraceae bacterium]|jgi:cysteine desulfurase family protein|nr:aminotransferase class V-fold PLP-dependent enzyme [Oscillospiraceae bacterium]